MPLSKLTQLMQRSSEQGLTLMETLVAIVIIELVVAMIAPPILLAGATRLQNQRVEQATQIAQGEVDRIRLLVERGDNELKNLPPLIPKSREQFPIQEIQAPRSIIDNNLANRTYEQVFAIYVDNKKDQNSPPDPDFVVQTFRAKERWVAGIPVPVAFMIGVRVYSYRTFKNQVGYLDTKPLRIGFTAGFTTDESKNRPLAVFYTPIIRSEQGSSLCEYRKLLDPTLNSTATCS